LPQGTNSDFIIPLSCHTMSSTLDISNFELCEIKLSKFEISKVYALRLQRYTDYKILKRWIDLIPLI